MKQITFFSFCFWAIFPVFAQTDPQSQAYGAKSLGMGGLKLYQKDSWTFFNNIGAMDRLEQSELNFGVDQRYGIKELSTYCFSTVFKKEFGSIGAGISRFGGDFFNQQLIGIGFSNTLGNISFGGKIDWFQTQIEGFGTGNAFFISIGGVTQLGPDFYLSSNFSNLNRSKIGKNSTQFLPTLVIFGFSYFPSSSLSIHSELEKDVDLPAIFKAGIEYSISNWIFLRTGISSNPSRMSFGLGVRNKKFCFDYGYGQQSSLGQTHHVSFGLRF